MQPRDMMQTVHPGHLRWRKWKNRLFAGVIFGLALLAVLPLLLILAYVVFRGAPGVSLRFFTSLPAPTGIPGGMANAIVGSIVMVLMATAMSAPVGVTIGLFLAETHHARWQNMVRFVCDVLSGTPTIVIGLLVYAMVVAPSGGFSGFSGSVALAILMLPTIARSSEQVFRLVPVTLREAGHALGGTRTQVWLRILLPTARAGVITGLLLAVSRALGETAPLMFTAFGNQFWSNNVTQPTAALPLQVFTYALSPYDDWHQSAWTGALTLVAIALIINLFARWVSRTRR
ncbi:phosphate transport system permease protein PstA [Alicyclobacillus cellulosilyticus]|uniref:Phosphate transport system permease protein PstA n=1 Tax=Alicyclobacillus cellulosilyticus TaxID=1003997 RepID=A0A917K7Q3_9BACL|nr:phosphate ABC transporter permease PstA [Alicyclobacillus cellulosilyticus]GGJ04088.1 phosphate transport system permease protein PstA [Alicyclobacillus cellulosilyticus]